MENKLITGIIGVVVVFALLGYALVPVIDNLTDGGTETQTLSQEGAGWVRMVYDTAPNSYYAVNLAVSDDAYTATNNIQDGAEPDVQSGSDDSILYADSNLAVWGQDGSIIVLGTDADGANYFLQSDDGVRVVRSEDKVEVFDVGGTDLYATFGVPSYAFIPVSTGGYGFFENGTEAALQENVPAPIVGGGFAGVFGYDSMIGYNLGRQVLQKEFTEDGKLSAAYWEYALPPVEPTMVDFDPSTITIQPLDPSVIDPIDLGGGAQLMSVPTPSYIDGEWGYDLMTVGGVQKAKIVSYSGAGGDVVVPATVGGYDVYRLGKQDANTSAQQVFDNTAIASDTHITISEGIVEIGSTAFSGCSNITQITFPSTITTIYYKCFDNCGISGFITLPPNLTTTYSGFNGCSGVTGISDLPSTVTTIPNNYLTGTGYTGTFVIGDTVTVIGYRSFYNAQHLEGLVIPESVTDFGTNTIFGTSSLKGFVIASDSTPASATQFSTNNTSFELLDLSDTIDYSVDRYGIPDAVAVSDNIGDALGYISYSEIEITVPGGGGLGGSAASLLYVIPAVIIATLLIAAVGWFVYNRY